VSYARVGERSGLKPTVFLSYARDEIALARSLADGLRSADVDVWLDVDSLRPGERFKESIRKGLSDSDAMIFIVTPNGLASSWVNRELGAFVESSNRPLIPIVVALLTFVDLPLFLQQYQGVYVIATRVLNEVFRPVLSSWHGELSAYEGRRATEAPTVDPVEWERRWPAASACRDDLVALRKQARACAETLALIAGVPSLGDAAQAVPPSRLWEETRIPASEAKMDLRSAKTSRMVGWVSAWTLFRTFLARHKAQQRGAAGMFDPSKDQAEPHSYPAKPSETFRFDYVADLGDGFDATAAIGWVLDRESLELPDDPSDELPSPPVSLERGRLLIMGGDQVYPLAGPGEYRDRVVVPYTAAWQGEKKEADGVAIHGNHDWYGGIEHFDAAFVDSSNLGNWSTPQRRRFWHIELPQGWWIWAIDTHLHNTLSSDQVEYFKAAASELHVGDRVIVCTPVPMWQLRQKDPDAYRHVRSVIEGPVRDQKATIRLWLSGDSHLFAHYENSERDGGEDHITSGGGGAFTSATHNLPERIPVERGNPEFTLTSRWPSATDSRSLAMSVPHLRDRQFWISAVVAGLLHWAFAEAVTSWRVPLIDKWADSRWKALPKAVRSVLTSPTSWVAIGICLVVGVASLTANSKEPRLRAGSRAWGAVVGSALAATFLIVAAARRAIDPQVWWERPIAFVVGGWLSVVAFFSALAWANRSVKAGDNLALHRAARHASSTSSGSASTDRVISRPMLWVSILSDKIGPKRSALNARFRHSTQQGLLDCTTSGGKCSRNSAHLRFVLPSQSPKHPTSTTSSCRRCTRRSARRSSIAATESCTEAYRSNTKIPHPSSRPTSRRP
jgi:hypothetical protein